jgi:hypothetical protein
MESVQVVSLVDARVLCLGDFFWGGFFGSWGVFVASFSLGRDNCMEGVMGLCSVCSWVIHRV